jgi:hypothetical protein
MNRRTLLKLAATSSLLGRGSSAPAGQCVSPSPRCRRQGQGCRAFREAEYSALPQITNIEAIISTINGTIMHFDLTDEETAALLRELDEIVENDRYPFSPRIRTLRAILAKLRPEPVRKPLPQKVYAPPSKGRYRRRRG